MYKVLLILLFQIVLIEARQCLNHLILFVFNLYILSQHYVSIKNSYIFLSNQTSYHYALTLLFTFFTSTNAFCSQVFSLI